MHIVVEKMTTVVVEVIERGWIVTCAKCRGRGIEPSYSEKNCTSCDGVGKRRLPLPSGADLRLDWAPVFCGHCNGGGIEPTYSERSCVCCEGRGVQAGAFPRVGCAKCQGSGIEPGYSEKVCTGSGCSGRGTVHMDFVR